MEKYIGEVRVRAEQDGKYIVKVMIVDYPERTEANILINKEDVKALGIKTLKQAQTCFPQMKTFLLAEINKTFPSYWDIDY